MVTDEAKNTASGAVSYGRVSSQKQTVQGHGLKSQEARCKEFVRHKGYDVIATFSDDISGGQRNARE